MEGVVKLANPDTGLFVVEIEDTFTVFEAPDADEIECGDVIAGNLNSTTCDSVLNNSKDQAIDVYVRDIVATLSAAEALLSGE